MYNVVTPLCDWLDVEAMDPDRSVYHCRVLGGRGCGKTSFVRGLIGQSEVAAEDGEEAMTIKGLTLPDTQRQVYLVVSLCF